MSKTRIQTVPNLADTSPKHQEAIKAGEAHLRAWQFNVADHFKSKTVEEIKNELTAKAFPYAVCMEHLIGDFNFATVVRNANAFNARKVFYIGDKRWDRRGATGVHNYTDVQFLPTVEELKALKNDYIFVGVDNVPGSIMMQSHTWQPNTLLILGEEGVGLTTAMQAMCDVIVEIPMYGSVRSLNVGTASGILMNDFVSRINK